MRLSLHIFENLYVENNLPNRVFTNSNQLQFTLFAQTENVPSPKSVLGFQPTDDKTIADWKQITGYFAKLDAASPRVKVEEIGKTTLGKPQIVAFISSAENIANLSEIKETNREVTDPTLTLLGSPGDPEIAWGMPRR